jgi:hypothetical protein
MVIPVINLCNIVIYIYPNNYRSQKLTQNKEIKVKIDAESRKQHPRHTAQVPKMGRGGDNELGRKSRTLT